LRQTKRIIAPTSRETAGTVSKNTCRETAALVGNACRELLNLQGNCRPCREDTCRETVGSIRKHARQTAASVETQAGKTATLVKTVAGKLPRYDGNYGEEGSTLFPDDS